ncbi:MAG: hypothetical protein R3B41_00315 [Candidatus Doudnabacteria bacterium]
MPEKPSFNPDLPQRSIDRETIYLHINEAEDSPFENEEQELEYLKNEVLAVESELKEALDSQNFNTSTQLHGYSRAFYNRIQQLENKFKDQE